MVRLLALISVGAEFPFKLNPSRKKENAKNQGRGAQERLEIGDTHSFRKISEKITFKMLNRVLLTLHLLRVLSSPKIV